MFRMDICVRGRMGKVWGSGLGNGGGVVLAFLCVIIGWTLVGHGQ